MTKSEILQEVTNFYLGSRDFNGLPAIQLVKKVGDGWNELRPAVQELIQEDLVGVLYGDIELNTHILRLGFPPKDIQISKLSTDELFHTCLYPRPNHLEKIVTPAQFAGEPYKLCMALGEPQFAFRSFDLSVLELYRNDPRYFYNNDDINGSIIGVKSEYYESNKMAERDQVLLQTFGFSYDEDLNRAVATYIRYLADLSPEHQQIWKMRELTGDYKLHPDYFRNTIGDWGEKVPIFSAFINELYIVNRMAEAMSRPPLFRKDYGEYGEDRPQKLSFLVRPTLEEFNGFVLLLDKLLSDNINKDFFQGEVSYESESERKDGKIVVQSKGTLQILDDWVRKHFSTDDWEPWDESIKTMREVRRLRQKPAHAIDENLFDQRYFKEQRELIIRAYSAIRTLRLLLANHYAVRRANIKIPKWLLEGEIWTY